VARTKRTIWREDKRIAQDVGTGSGAMSLTFDPEGACILDEIRLHLDTASITSENFVVTLDSCAGSKYDVIFVTQDMNTIKDLVIPCVHKLNDIDKLVFEWTNTDSRTWGLEVVFRNFSA
jgi:precorrin-6B methylase 2